MMCYVCSQRFFTYSLAITAVGIVASQAGAAILYDSTVVAAGAGQTAVLVRPHLPPDSTDTTGVGEGDDYTTSFTSLNVTGLSFFGSVGPSTNFVASFYDAARTLIASVTPAAGELTNSSALQTLGAADFGPGGITVPGNGYVVFTVTSSDGVTRPSFNLQYQTGTATVGTNNTASGVRIDYQNNFTVGAFFNANVFSNGGFIRVPANVAEFQLIGVGVPEPTSLGILGVSAVCGLRRRRSVSV